MYNLGLGNLKFSVNHTIEEHRPEGHSIPENLWDGNGTNPEKQSHMSAWHSIVFKQMHGKSHQHQGNLLHVNGK